MASHSSTPAWRIPWTEEPGRLQSMGSLRVRHDWVTSLSLFTCMHWKRKWQPTPVFLPGEFQGWGTWWAAVYGVAQSWTRLKRLSSSSSRNIRENTTLKIPSATFKSSAVLIEYSNFNVDMKQRWLLFLAFYLENTISGFYKGLGISQQCVLF